MTDFMCEDDFEVCCFDVTDAEAYKELRGSWKRRDIPHLQETSLPDSLRLIVTTGQDQSELPPSLPPKLFEFERTLKLATRAAD